MLCLKRCPIHEGASETVVWTSSLTIDDRVVSSVDKTFEIGQVIILVYLCVLYVKYSDTGSTLNILCNISASFFSETAAFTVSLHMLNK